MFKIDSPIANILNKATDIMILDILFIISCIPVITAGAALAAAYYISFKMVKDEEAYIVRGFFKAFKENFKQAFILWLFVLVLIGIIAADYIIILYSGMVFGLWAKAAVFAVTLAAALGILFIFPVQARFQNTVKNTIKNAFCMAFAHLPSAILLLFISALPLAVLYFVPQLFSAVVFLGLGGIFYLQSFVLLRVFKKYEPKEEPIQSVYDN